MAKQVEAIIKLQIKAGAANPSPPVGPALGSKGVNIMDFCKQFNARMSVWCSILAIWKNRLVGQVRKAKSMRRGGSGERVPSPIL